MRELSHARQLNMFIQHHAKYISKNMMGKLSNQNSFNVFQAHHARHGLTTTHVLGLALT